uniref:C-type lectin domain-containing protein n=1 Tax=Electrophorus electricus TaxID=8005 RepID=A0AAY5ES60_ELEEL
NKCFLDSLHVLESTKTVCKFSLKESCETILVCCFCISVGVEYCYFCISESVGYIGVNVAKSWQDAQSYCRERYTDLATISSPWQQNLLTELVGKGVYVWVGLFLDTWQWSDQWSLSFRNWAAGLPNSGTGNCVTMVTNYSGKWTVDNCNLQYPFICYGGFDWPCTFGVSFLTRIQPLGYFLV